MLSMVKVGMLEGWLEDAAMGEMVVWRIATPETHI